MAGTAEVKWKKVSGATSYEYAILTHPSPPAVGSFTSITDTILRLSDLTPGGKYWVHIRTHCGNKGVSGWTSVLFYTTGIEVFPNPTTGTALVRIHGVDLNNGKLSLFDAAGRLMMELMLTGNMVNVNLAGFAGGVYLIKYKDGKQEYITRLIKQ